MSVTKQPKASFLFFLCVCVYVCDNCICSACVCVCEIYIIQRKCVWGEGGGGEMSISYEISISSCL